ncbi:MAG: hypothetical protein K1X86_16020 [Ignavibacteria bacterium]|nr:hypothetical protein [Ignavibacteria bacterium]
MRKIILIFSLTLKLITAFSISLFAQETELWDWKTPYGTKSIVEKKIKVTGTQEILQDSVIYVFSKEGKLTDIILENLEPINRKEFIYNNVGKIKEERWYNLSTVQLKYFYEYEKNGSLEKVILHKSNYDEIENSYNYDTKGRLISINSSIPVKFKIENFYNLKDQKFKSIFSGNSATQKELNYLYDENGKIIQQTILIAQKNNTTSKKYQMSKITFEYDVSGKLVKKNNFIAEDLSESFIYGYDEQGNLDKWEKYDAQKNLVYKVKYEYVKF